MKDSQFAKLVVFVCSLVPLVLLGLELVQGRAGPDVRTHTMKVTGITALMFLCLSLCVTPLRKITGKNYWSLYRRMLGLYAFTYACAHVTCYLTYDLKWDFGRLLKDIKTRQIIFFGMLAFATMIPLAATSTAGAIKRLGAKRWKWLHRLVYISATSAAVHFVLFPKVRQIDSLPTLFAVIIGGLLLYRIVTALMVAARKRQSALVARA